MEHIRKGWGAHLVGDIFCAQPLLPVLSLSIVIIASGWRAYCFQTLLKMEHIRKGWGAHLVGDIFCA